MNSKRTVSGQAYAVKRKMALTINYVEKMLPISMFLFFYMIVYAVHLLCVPQLIETRICLKEYNQTACENIITRRSSQEFTDIRKHSLSWQWIMTLTSAIPSMAVLIFFGTVAGLSKSIKRIILFSIVILALQSLVYLLVGVYSFAPIYCLLIGNSITVVYGGFQGASLLAYVYVAKNTKPDSYRTIKFAVLAGTSYCAFALGKYGASYMMRAFDHKGVFGITLAACLSNFIMVLLLLPSTTDVDEVEDTANFTSETIKSQNSDNHSQQSDEAKTSDSNDGLLDKAKQVFCSECLLGSMEYLAAVILSYFLYELGRWGQFYLLPNVAQFPGLSLSPEGTERYVFLLRLAQGLASVPLVILLTKACCMATDVMVLFTALSSYALGLVLIGFSKTTAILFSVSSFTLCEPLITAGLKSTATKEVGPRAYGAVIAISGILSLGAMVLVRYFSTLYEQRVHKQYRYKHLAFIVLAITELMAFIVIGVASLRYQKPLVEFEDKESEEPKGEQKPLLTDS